MARGYATHASAAERALKNALSRVKHASQGDLEARSDHISWAITQVEAALRNLRLADPEAARLAVQRGIANASLQQGGGDHHG